MTDPTRGVLYPERLPRFTRILPEGAAAELVEWFWIPEWDLPDAVTSAQRTLGYPGANLVVEAGEMTLWGATTRVAERVLTGSGWAVGALLKPAAFAALAAQPRDLVDAHIVLDEPQVVASVSAAMPGDHVRAVAVLSAWLIERAGVVTGEGRLANRMIRMLLDDPEILRLEDAAARLSVSPRTLQRLAHRTLGVSPAAVIRRRRLQEAAQRVREDPDVRLAEIAAELGYADQAHLANDFRTVLGFTASEYRATPSGAA